MLGDKVKEYIRELTTSAIEYKMGCSYEVDDNLWAESEKELNQLIESHEKRVKLEERLEAITLEVSDIVYSKLDDIEQLKKDALLGRALRDAFTDGGYIKMGEGYQSDIYDFEEIFKQSEYYQNQNKEV